jgi:Flp pilus assembly protein TadD
MASGVRIPEVGDLCAFWRLHRTWEDRARHDRSSRGPGRASAGTALDVLLQSLPEMGSRVAQLPPAKPIRQTGLFVKTGILPMNTRALLLGGISALLLGGTMAGCAANSGRIASVSDRSNALAVRTASRDAGKAKTALARREAAVAIGYAERAVVYAPMSATYRMLLGQSYLQGGRFTSALRAFADTLELSPSNGKAALNLALSQVATGDWQAARHTLEANAATIPAIDRGLALSLSGDTAGGIALLTEVARSPATSAKVRQNLALSYALAGRWQEARVVAEADLAPADVDARIEQWALFTQPTTASDQVASLLGVRAVADTGQPVALALNRGAPAGPSVP